MKMKMKICLINVHSCDHFENEALRMKFSSFHSYSMTGENEIGRATVGTYRFIKVLKRGAVLYQQVALGLQLRLEAADGLFLALHL